MGRRLFAKVEDAMAKSNLPTVRGIDMMKKVLSVMTSGRLDLRLFRMNQAA